MVPKPISDAATTRGHDAPAAAPLGLHEEVLLLAVRDAEGTVDPRAVHWAEALAAATLAELVLLGHLALDATRGGLLTAAPGDAPDDPVLAGVLGRVRRFGKTATLAYWTDRLCRETKWRIATAEGLVRRRILAVRRHGAIPFFSTKSLPARDIGPETALRAELKKAPLRPAPSPRNSARLALVVVGDLLANVYPSAPDQEAARRVRRAIRAHPIGRAIVDAVDAVHEARLASKNARYRAITATRHWALWTGVLGQRAQDWARRAEGMTSRDPR